MTDFEVVAIVMLVGLCGLIKRHSDREWKRLNEETNAEHRKKVGDALKKFVEGRNNANT